MRWALDGTESDLNARRVGLRGERRPADSEAGARVVRAHGAAGALTGCRFRRWYYPQPVLLPQLTQV